MNIKDEETAKEKRMTFSLQMLENQFIKMENDPDTLNEESKINKEKPAVEKFSSIPNMLKCYICEGIQNIVIFYTKILIFTS